MEKSTTLHYIKLTFIPCDCDVALHKNTPLAPKQKGCDSGPREVVESQILGDLGRSPNLKY